MLHAIDRAAHLLPEQGPINVFIHHNTLHAFEHMSFEQAVQDGGKAFGCEPYLAEERYRAELGRGRIRFDGLIAVLEDDLGFEAFAPVTRLTTRHDLRLAMLQHPIGAGPAAELDYFMAETNALRRVRGDVSATAHGRLLAESRRWVMRDLRGRVGHGEPHWANELLVRFGAQRIESWNESTWEAVALELLWCVCRDGVAGVPAANAALPVPIRHRDLIVLATGRDPDLEVNDLLAQYCSAFLDQGISHWPLPNRADGFFHSFLSLYGRAGGPPTPWLKPLRPECLRLLNDRVGPLESVRDSLDALGVKEAEWEAYLSAMFLALRGWAGMLRHVEQRGDRVAHPVPSGTLLEYAAVRLVLDRIAAIHAAKQVLGSAGSLAELRDALRAQLPLPAAPMTAQRAFPLFQLAQIFGWSPDELHRLSPAEWHRLVREVEGFNGVERRRVFHLAYERRFYFQALDALALHARQGPAVAPGQAPRFQWITCLDEREESFRRHLEEVAPDCATFGTAGFFAIAMYYRGATEAHFVPLCPIVMTPSHWVEEQADVQLEDAHRRLRRTQRVLGTAAHQAHVGTRSFAAGALLTATLGVLASIPLVARILFPRGTAWVRERVGGYMHRTPKTQLRLERSPAADPRPQNGHLGFTPDEMVLMAEQMLRDIGLPSGFSRLVFTVGHGSSSLNNPHRSAYNCGACGGSSGAPNGRAAAQLLNDPRVRRGLTGRGLSIPDDTWFVGGFHNTCSDALTLFDLDRVPDSHRAELERARGEIEEACNRNAHERCRRFLSARLDMTFEEARRHVEARSEDLAQTRPELGHATNAIAHVGRRERSRGLYFDRRAFFTSYDPTQDNETGDILARTLGAIFPVCGGINLEYFFSHIDPAGYGCGTKLPHNVSALLGVMDGARSDLRTGLPWQMAEIHEPVRLLVVCETSPEVIRHVLANNPMGKALTENGWVQLALQSPNTNDLLVYQSGEFRPYRPQADHLPRAASSADWYRGWRDHLEFAEIGPGV